MSIHVPTPKGAILLNNGKLVDPGELRVEDLEVPMLAHSLAQQNRYTGHAKAPYSVAEHSVLLSIAVPEQLQRAAMVHDMSECFVTDMARPVKRRFPDFMKFEEEIQVVILKRFGVSDAEMMDLHEYDTRICQDEMTYLFDGFDFGQQPLGVKIRCWYWTEARDQFIHRCKELNIG